VPPILPQVDDDSVSSGQFSDDRGGDRVRILAAPGLSQSGYMINIHRQFGHEFLLNKSDQPISFQRSAKNEKNIIYSEVRWDS
jgi:hypothetical protein